MQLGVTSRLVGDLRSPQQNAPPSRGAVMLRQNMLPRIVAFVAMDADNGDRVLGRGDTFRVVFDRRALPPPAACEHHTNGVSWPCAGAGGSRLVEELFDFSNRSVQPSAANGLARGPSS